MSAAMAAAQLLRDRGMGARVDMAAVLGTGFGPVAEMLNAPAVVSYQELPGFPQTAAPDHAGRLLIGVQEGVRVAYLQGRAHFHECGHAGAMATALETMALLGAGTLFLTATVGSVRSGLYPGKVAMITDHINISGINPLIGTPADGRFVNLVDAYDPHLRQRLKKAAAGAGVSLQEAVYMWLPGPSFETPAEARVARQLGADVVGTSVVPEVIIARQFGLHVAALAIVTNFAAGFSDVNPSQEETQRGALSGTVAVKRLIRNFLKTKGEI